MKICCALIVLLVGPLSYGYSLGRVMCLGDSLTEGAGIGVRGGGYRVQLQTSLNSHNLTLLYVGTLTGHTGPLFPSNPKHEGHGGWTTEDLITGKNGEGNVVTWIKQEDPDKIILMIGQNDPGDWSYLPIQYKELVDLIFLTKPTVRLYWSNLIAVEPHDTYNYFHCQQADGAIRSLVPYYNLLGRSVTFMDAFRFTYNIAGMHDSGGVHLSDLGYDILGDYYGKYVRKSLYTAVPNGGFP